MRRLYNDGFNSLAHFSFGLVAALWVYGLPLLAGFIAYQMIEWFYKNDNVFIDISEFLIPFSVIKFLAL